MKNIQVLHGHFLKSKVAEQYSPVDFSQVFLTLYAVLCYGSELGLELGSDGSTVVAKSKKAVKMKTSSKKKSTADQQPLKLGDDNPEIMQRVRGEEGDLEEVEVFPSKTVAMHRVRWNMNKGSENWLCYGGAAGVLRCQEIDIFGR